MTTKKNKIIKKLLCALAASIGLLTLLLSYTSTQAQHIDVFNIPREEAEAKKPENVPELVEVEVTDKFTYKVVVEKELLDKNNVFARELDIDALTDEEKSPYHWGQVEYYDRRNIMQMQERTTGFLKCFRTRTGVLYFLPNGKKVVDWGRWSMWDCR